MLGAGSKSLKAIALVACSSMLAFVAGCGSSSKSSSPSTVGAAGPAPTRTLKIGTDPTYPPYEFKNGSQYAGFEIDVMRALGKQMNANVTFSDVKYSAAYGAVDAGRFDAAVIGGTPESAERRRVATLVDYFTAAEGMMLPKGNPKHLTSLKSLCGHTVSLFAGTVWISSVQTASKQDCGSNPIKTLLLSDANGPYQAVQTGRADAYYGDYFQAAYQAKKLNMEAVPASDGFKYKASFPVARGNTALAQQFAKAMQALVDNGQLTALASKYGIPSSSILKTITVDGK